MFNHVCLHCGKSFNSKDRNRKFCSKTCSNRHGVHRTKDLKNIHICKYCKKEFYVYPHLLLKDRGIYCSKECAYNDMVKKNEIIVENDIIKIILKSEKYETQYALIDFEDYEKIKNYTWWVNAKHYPKFYVNAWDRKNKKRIQLHRIITNCPKELVVDHINHNPLDNRKCNLKVCTQLENMQNISKSKT